MPNILGPVFGFAWEAQWPTSWPVLCCVRPQRRNVGVVRIPAGYGDKLRLRPATCRIYYPTLGAAFKEPNASSKFTDFRENRQSEKMHRKPGLAGPLSGAGKSAQHALLLAV
jgi:hypothetical protein